MIAVGARFDDRVTGRLADFSPGSKKIHIDIDPSSVNKNVPVEVPLIGDAGEVLGQLLRAWKAREPRPDAAAQAKWWKRIETWRARDCLKFAGSETAIKPQHAIKRLYEMTRDRDVYITTEVGQHQMWAAQYFKFEEPNRWMTSGGLPRVGPAMPRNAGNARPLRGQPRDARVRRDDQCRRAVRRPGDRAPRRLLARLEEDPHRHRDPSSVNKNVPVEVPLIGDAGEVLGQLLRAWKAREPRPDAAAQAKW